MKGADTASRGLPVKLMAGYFAVSSEAFAG
jgi:hypothetical protein